jgi:hypothetical protein
LAQVISVNGKPSNDVTGRVEVTVGNANIDDLVLPLVPRPAITGTVTLEDGDIATLIKPASNTSGVPAAGNATFAPPRRLALSLVQTENGLNGRFTTQVNEADTFRFNGIGLGKYVLNIPTLDGMYLKSARFEGQDVQRASIDTTSGAGGTLELMLSSKAATVTGSVQSEKGESLVITLVTLWPKTPDSGPTGGFHFGFTDQNGAFKFQDLPPGDYYVAAWDQPGPGLGLTTSIDFLSHFTSDASAITLAEGGQESKDLKPVPADKVAVEIAKLP